MCTDYKQDFGVGLFLKAPSVKISESAKFYLFNKFILPQSFGKKLSGCMDSTICGYFQAGLLVSQFINFKTGIFFFG